MKNEIENYISRIITHYNSWMTDDEMRERFAKGIEVTHGRAYTKIVTSGSVHSFIVNRHNDKKFAYGDVLKAATWSAPARNFARGNVFEPESINVRWAGV